MRKLIAGLMAGIIVGACGTAAAKEKDPTGYFSDKTSNDQMSDVGWHVIKTPEDKTLECVWADNGYDEGGGGISCNWELYNQPK